tara:strand:+ start:505 stop:654 length:150 start_codon:yes stop_codon:yes gene_type:complete
MKRLDNKKPATIELAKELIDRGTYINLLIINPFKAGATEQKSFLISIDS